jgi:hypothetical protein
VVSAAAAAAESRERESLLEREEKKIGEMELKPTL